MKKEYKYTINGNKYEVAIGDIVENEVTVTVNGEEYKVSDWDDYVKSIEDRYYKQFSKMESAMTKLNSQQNYVASMFGM